MPTFSRSLEQSLHRALALANERHHEYATLEHLLLALIDDPDAAEVMTHCGVDLGDLSEVVKQYLDQEYQSLKTKDKGDPAPTAGFQRVIQRAILHVQSSGKDVVRAAARSRVRLDQGKGRPPRGVTWLTTVWKVAAGSPVVE